MTVQATKVVNRDIYDVTYDGASGEGIVHAKMTNPDTGDVSTTDTKNDGAFTVSVGTGYEGTADVEITDAAGHEIDSGTVTFGAAAPEGPSAPNDLHPAHPIVLPTPPTPSHPIADTGPQVEHRDDDEA
jgi:hypothetical protein